MIARCAALAFLLLAGCQGGWHGRSRIQIMEPLPAPPPPASTQAAEVQSEHETVFSPARPYGELVKPAYPAAALAARAGGYEAYMKIHLDERGEITSVEPSLRGVTLPHPYAAAFQAAIREAVGKWQFRAACLTYYRYTDKNGGKSSEITRIEYLPDTLDIHFTFDASGKVR